MVYFSGAYLTDDIHLTNSKSWVTIHGLNNFHSLCEKRKMFMKDAVWLLIQLVKTYILGTLEAVLSLQYIVIFQVLRQIVPEQL